MKKYGLSISISLVALSGKVFAGGSGVPQVINYYELASQAAGVSKELWPLFASVFALFLLLMLGLFYKGAVEKELKDPELKPSGKFSLLVLLQTIMDFLFSMTKDQCGEKHSSFFPFVSCLFLFIFVSNLSGLVPGFPPATENFSLNLVLGAVVFFVYNAAGVREHGVAYLKHFTGPFAILAPMFLVLELVSHCARPLSLSFRLTANIFGDHLLLGVFSGMLPLIAPVGLLFFGLLVACIQSFVFTMLTTIYISMAISHDH